MYQLTIGFTEKPTDAPRTMFISKDQWVEEGAELRLYCEALIGKHHLVLKELETQIPGESEPCHLNLLSLIFIQL